MLLIRFEYCRFALKASPRFIGLKLDGPKLGGPLTTEIEQDDIERSFEPVWTVIRLNEFYGPDMGIGFEKNA